MKFCLKLFQRTCCKVEEKGEDLSQLVTREAVALLTSWWGWQFRGLCAFAGPAHTSALSPIFDHAYERVR